MDTTWGTTTAAQPGDGTHRGETTGCQWGSEGADDRAQAGTPVVLIDDHELFAGSLVAALRSGGFNAVRLHVSYGPAILGELAQLPPGLALLDAHLNADVADARLDHAMLIEGMRALGWTVLIVGDTHGAAGRRRIAEAVTAGARAVVCRSLSLPVVLDMVRRAVAGGVLMSEAERREWVQRHRAHQERQRFFEARLAQLTPGERDVLDLIVRGHRAAAIAEHFAVSPTTVRGEIRSMLAKLGVWSQLEAVALVRAMR